ncbi:hypothetical protein EIN_325210 [Entamoeba invadens IP1]|uniref:Uncharacterized protein n=1 Tax=Entamoeba invadens IP1 TaxID=370355 RepID=L7FP56_ENTIV|nr:hypothetical protein EIN_325210 [Entamoeba invadens IP1]ELP92979.1 hypothetical protein EIN_325210 [Entamoeba invadens IP1]|eukprot:XP_004259750.1 hypothetical protein EIN_325210 [Entamoeba invadens IP1]
MELFETHFGGSEHFTLDIGSDNKHIRVNEFSKQSTSFGNLKCHHTVIISIVSEMITTKKYEILSTPNKVVLKRREGCKVEISIKPLCSTHIQDKLQIVVDDAFNGKRTIGTLSMEIVTEVTTSLNYSEVKEESYLNAEGSCDAGQIQKRVYSALLWCCFVPTKICIVTEYADFGSLHFIMENRKKSPITNKMKTKKFCMYTLMGSSIEILSSELLFEQLF